MEQQHQITHSHQTSLNIKEQIQEMNELLNHIFLWMNQHVLDYLLLEEVIKIVNDCTNPALIIAFQTRLDVELKSKAMQCQLKNNNQNIILLYKGIVLFMIIVKNLNTSDKFKRIFKGSHQILTTLKDIMKQCQESKKTNYISKLILNLFFDEYKELFFHDESDEELHDLYIKYMSEFSSINIEGPDYTILKSYDSLMSYIYDFKFSIIAFSNEVIEEKSSLVGRVCQSIFEMLFSQEKQHFIKNNLDDNTNKCYEIRTLQNIIKNYVQRLKIHENIFRKEDIENEFMKTIFLSFGNTFFIKTFLQPVKKHFPLFDENQEITIEEFSKFFNNFIDILNQSMPLILKINRDMSTDKFSYNPLFTILIFNFFISPKIQDIYSIGPKKSKLIREINRILRNIAFDTLFKEEDNLIKFNNIIPISNNLLISFVKETILIIDLENIDINRTIQSTFTKENLILPKLLFTLNGALITSFVQDVLLK